MDTWRTVDYRGRAGFKLQEGIVKREACSRIHHVMMLSRESPNLGQNIAWAGVYDCCVYVFVETPGKEGIWGGNGKRV